MNEADFASAWFAIQLGKWPIDESLHDRLLPNRCITRKDASICSREEVGWF
jgi:hypothetical protein